MPILNISYKWNHAIFLCVWNISLSVMFLKLIHIVLYIQFHSFLLLNNVHYMRIPHFLIHEIADRHLGCFYLLTIVNRAAMNTNIPIFLWVSVFNTLGYTSRCWIWVTDLLLEIKWCFGVKKALCYLSHSLSLYEATLVTSSLTCMPSAHYNCCLGHRDMNASGTRAG